MAGRVGMLQLASMTPLEATGLGGEQPWLERCLDGTPEPGTLAHGLLPALTAQEINAAQLGRELGITPTTARHRLDMLGACYPWRELPAFSGNAVKRVSGKRKGLMGDSGLACWLQRLSSPDALSEFVIAVPWDAR